MINGQSLYWNALSGGDDGGQHSLDDLVKQDQLEQLLEIKTLSFELRSENQALVDYLSKPHIVKRLFAIMFARDHKGITDKAIDIFSCAEALRGAFQAVLTTKELLQTPFSTLQQYTDVENLRPKGEAPPHVYAAFGKFFQGLLAAPKRAQQLVQFLQQNPEWLKIWVSNLFSPKVLDSFKALVLDFKTRPDEAVKALSALFKSSGLLDGLLKMITDPATPLECTSATCGVLAQAIQQEVPYLQEQLMFQVSGVLRFFLTAELVGKEQLRFSHLIDYIVCCLSFMLQKSLNLYQNNASKLQKVKFDVVQIRNSLEVTGKTELAAIRELDIADIDNYEKQAFPVYVQCVKLLEETLMNRYNRLRQAAGPGLFGFGAFNLVKLLGRICAISADLKTQVLASRKASASSRHRLDWASGEGGGDEFGAPSGAPPEGGWAALQSSAHAGCGGPPNVSLSETLSVQGVRLALSVPGLLRAALRSGVVATLVEELGSFPEGSNLHFACSRLLVPLAEFGDADAEIGGYLFTKTRLLEGIAGSAATFTAFKARSSLLSFYITFARALLRLCLRLPDDAQVLDKQKFVAGRGDVEDAQGLQQSPANYNAMLKMLQGAEKPDKALAAFLDASEPFKRFSKDFLEPEEEVPKTFGDARLTAEYAAAKKQMKKRSQGVFDSGFGGFGGFGGGGGGDFFGLGTGDAAWGGLGGFGATDASADQQGAQSGAANPADQFGFGWGGF